MRWILCFLLLSAAVWARQPEVVVEDVLSTHLRVQNLEKTVRATTRCWTSGFLGVIERALARRPGQGGGAYVDSDFLSRSQTELGFYEVGRATVTGKEARVPVKVWNGLRSLKELKDPKKRAGWQWTCKATYHLTDVGEGFQIKDIVYAPYTQKQDGKSYPIAAWSVRKWLEQIGTGRWK